MLIDLQHVETNLANAAVDWLCKSIEEAMADDPHPTDPLTGAMEDAATLPVRRCLLGLYDAMLAVLVTGNQTLHKAANESNWLTATARKCDVLEQLIARNPGGTLTFMDYMDVIDCLLLRYLPEDVLLDAVRGQAVKQYLTGHLRAQNVSQQHPSITIAALPTTTKQSLSMWRDLKPYDESVIKVAQANVGRLVTDLRNSTRSRLKKIVIDAERQRLNAGTPAFDATPIQQQLADTFGDLNRDWRRIAVTETAINAADGYLMTLEVGSYVRWVAHAGCCDYCRSMQDTTYEVVNPNTVHKDAYAQVWIGKHIMNVGRSIAKRKRLEDGTMGDRSDTERIVPAIPAHPHCRCIWVQELVNRK